MTAVPATFTLTMTFQDLQGFRSQTRIRAYLNDISTSTTVLGDMYAVATAVNAKVAAASNAKLIHTSMGQEWGWAQEPITESGKYELTRQKARIQGGDGAGAFMSMEIPAPVDALFFSGSLTQDNLIVVNPASTSWTNLQSAIVTASGTFQLDTARGGHPFSQMFGGQLIEDKPARRRVLQGV